MGELSCEVVGVVRVERLEGIGVGAFRDSGITCVGDLFVRGENCVGCIV